VQRFDLERGPGCRQRSVVVGQVVRQTTTTVVQRGQVGRGEEVPRVGLEVLRPGLDRVIDLGDRADGCATAIDRRDRGGRRLWCRALGDRRRGRLPNGTEQVRAGGHE
jgi:hypothetical protein